MGIFGRKKKKEPNAFSSRQINVQPPQFPPQVTPPRTALPQPMALPPPPAFSSTSPVQTSIPPGPKPSEDSGKPPTTAPLFIKLTRYRQILDNMDNIKTGLNLIKNQVVVMKEVERLRSENMKVLESSIDKLSKRLIKLDAEFTRPEGFMEELSETEIEEMESLESTITDLKQQIEGLKQEVEAIS